MGFKAPTFNLKCDLFTSGTYPAGPPRLVDVDCQWRTVAKMNGLSGTFGASFPTWFTELLMPKGTDVRFNVTALGVVDQQDTVVLKVTGGELYFETMYVYDVAKGFSNEYRIALVRTLWPWPIPIP